MTWKMTGMGIVLSALIYLALLVVGGEFRLSSRALVSFAIAWLVQSTLMLLQAWGHSRKVTCVGTSATDDIPPAG